MDNGLPAGFIYIPTPTGGMTNSLLKINITNRIMLHGVSKLSEGRLRRRILQWNDNADVATPDFADAGTNLLIPPPILFGLMQFRSHS
jgi:hypothetical protein